MCVAKLEYFFAFPRIIENKGREKNSSAIAVQKPQNSAKDLSGHSTFYSAPLSYAAKHWPQCQNYMNDIQKPWKY
jgi:hypothetical protein